MEDWGTGGGLQGAGAAFAVGLLPCSGVSATSVISTPPEDPAHSSHFWHPEPGPSQAFRFQTNICQKRTTTDKQVQILHKESSNRRKSFSRKSYYLEKRTFELALIVIGEAVAFKRMHIWKNAGVPKRESCLKQHAYTIFISPRQCLTGGTCRCKTRTHRLKHVLAIFRETSGLRTALMLLVQ